MKTLTRQQFVEVTLRAKAAFGVELDMHLAELIGMSQRAFTGRKSNGSFPEDKLRATAQRRPELGLDVDFILTGQRSEPAHKASAQAAPLSAAAAWFDAYVLGDAPPPAKDQAGCGAGQDEAGARALAHRHTLARHAPAMAQGFVIQTSYGDMAVPSGELAERIRALVEQDARLQLMRLELVQLNRRNGDAA